MFCNNVSTSVFQYLEKRFSKGVRTAGSLTFVTQMVSTLLPAKSDSDFMFCLQRYQGLRIDRSLVY